MGWDEMCKGGLKMLCPKMFLKFAKKEKKTEKTTTKEGTGSLVILQSDKQYQLAVYFKK